MQADPPLLEFADRLRTGYKRLVYKSKLAERRPLHDFCTGFDLKGMLATPVHEARYVVMDTETTGFRAYGGDEIVQIAMIEYKGLEPTGEEFASLVRPSIPIPPTSTEIHGIDDDMVSDAPAIDDIIDDVVQFIGESTIVGHHIAFDLRFLNRVIQRCLLCRLPQPTLDTMVLYLAHSGRLGRYTLEDVAAACGTPVLDRHDAHGDAETCGKIFSHLADRMVGRGATVAELIATTRLDREMDETGPPAA